MDGKKPSDADLSSLQQPSGGSVRPRVPASSPATPSSGRQPMPLPRVSTAGPVAGIEQSPDFQKTASVRTSRSLPTIDDYNQYMDNLLRIQDFIRSLESILGNCDERDFDVDLIRDLVSFYLEPLRLYQNDMRHIQNKIAPSVVSAPEALVEMLRDIEPQFKSVVDKLDRMQKKIGLEPSTDRSPIVTQIPSSPPSTPVPPSEVPPPVVTPTSSASPSKPVPGPSRPSSEVPPRVVTSTSSSSPSKPDPGPSRLPSEVPPRVVTPTSSSSSSKLVPGPSRPPSEVPPRVVTPTSSSSQSKPVPGPSRPSSEVPPRVDVNRSPTTPVVTKKKTHKPEGFIAMAQTCQTGRKLQEWMEDIRSRKREGKTIWRLDRRSDNFMQLVCEKYENAKDYELQRDLEIIFEGEKGSTREFFQTVFRYTMDDKFKDTRLMLGDVGHALPDATDDYLIHAFVFIGKVIAHAVYNGCGGLPGLSHALQSYLVYGKGPGHIEELRPPVFIDDVYEPDLHEVLSKLDNGTTLTKENKDVLQEWMDHSDCRILLKQDTRHLIIQDLLIYYVFKRRMSQIDALATGLDLFGLRKFLRENPTKENIATVFPVPNDMVIPPYKPKKDVIPRVLDEESHESSGPVPRPRPRPRKKPDPSGVIATAQEGRNLEEWANTIKQTKKDGKTILRLDRHSHVFLQMACEKYENAKEYELQRDLEIIFEKEQGTDRGALTREFFYVAFQCTMENKFKDMQLMVGDEGHVLPDATGEYLTHAFECIGKMIAHAVYNGCRGLPGLSPALQSYLVYGSGPGHIEELRPPVSIDDVCEPDLHEVLWKLENGTKLTRDNEAVLREWMDRSNCHIPLKPETRHLIIQDLLIYYVFKRRIGQIEALAAGLNLFGLRQFLRENPTKENIATVFPSPADFVISPEMFKEVVITRGESYDMNIWDYFDRFLQDLARGAIEGQSIADVVRFLSGSPYLPSRVVISFSQADVMPIAHACFNELQLPTKHKSYETFRDSMHDGIAHRDYTMDRVDEEHQRMQDSSEYS